MCIMSGMGRGTPKVRYTLLRLHLPSSVSFLSPISIKEEEEEEEENKGEGRRREVTGKEEEATIPLQTETRLMFDTVLKEHQDGMYLKISERKQVVFNAQKQFPISE